MKRQLHVKVFGVVQGVNLRYETCQKAGSLQLTGFVRNLSDGGVEIMAQGEEVNLQKLVDWLKSSPGYSHVNKVEQEEVKPLQEFDEFSILY